MLQHISTPIEKGCFFFKKCNIHFVILFTWDLFLSTFNVTMSCIMTCNVSEDAYLRNYTCTSHAGIIASQHVHRIKQYLNIIMLQFDIYLVCWGQKYANILNQFEKSRTCILLQYRYSCTCTYKNIRFFLFLFGFVCCSCGVFYGVGVFMTR